MKNLGIIFSLIFWLIRVSPAYSQTYLEGYIQKGLDQNLVLKERNLGLENSLLALKSAKSYFLPSLDLLSSYTWANGGRTIAIPIGDLLNPVYSTLNQLTNTNNFPQVENVSEQFLPDNFYDAKIRASLPVLNPDLIAQRKIRQQQAYFNEWDAEIYKQQLILDIKSAYYNYGMAVSALEVLTDSEILAERNLKTNRSLLANGKSLPAAVIRAESEVENVRAMMIDAENTRINARNYFNFLLNRSLTDTVYFEPLTADLNHIQQLLEESPNAGRPELQQIQSGLTIREIQFQNSRKYWVPRVNLFADFGSQGFDWTFDSQSRYSLMGVNLSMPIFQGNRNKNQISRAQIELSSIQNSKNLLESKLHLDWEIAKNEVKSQQAILNSAEKKLLSAKSYFKLIERGYGEGVNSLIEFLDAQNQLTQADLQKNLANYRLLQAIAKLERQLTKPTSSQFTR